MDFAAANLRYLLALRELARSDPHVAGLLAGVPDELTDAVAELDDERLLHVAGHHSPLVQPRNDAAWWQRLVEAAREGNDEEIECLLENNMNVTNGAKEG